MSVEAMAPCWNVACSGGFLLDNCLSATLSSVQLNADGAAPFQLEGGVARSADVDRKMLSLDGCVGGARCVALGVRDSLLGALPVLQLVRRNEKFRKQLLQCVFLNGVILLLSILIFDYLLLPAIQSIAGLAYGMVSNSSESGILAWLGTILWYTFTGFWVMPLFWISKPINSIWFQDIASTAFEERTKQRQTKSRRTKAEAASSLTLTISRFIADLLFSVVLEMLFLMQAMLVGLLPAVGSALSVLHMALLYALYAFEYKWIQQGWIVHQRVLYVEKNWPYFLGFGLPLAVLTFLPSSLFVSACIFAVSFPLFIVSANEAKPAHSALPQAPIFNVAVALSNKLFNRGTPAIMNSSARSK